MINTYTTPIRVLLIEDDEYDQFAFLRAVEQQELPYDVTVAETVSTTRELLKKQDFDIAIVDHNIGPDTAFAIFDDLIGLPFIIVTGAGDQELAVQAMKMGAFDYLVKDLQGNYLKALDVTVSNALQRKLAEIELKNYRENLEILVKERTQELSEANEQLRHEITERKQAEEMIRLQAIAMAAADNGITILDLEGKIIWANPALCQILGCLDSAIIGNSVLTLFKGAAESESILLSFQNAIRNREKWAGEINNYRPDGSNYSVEIVTTPVPNIDGVITHFTTILHDITERVKSQKLLKYLATHDSLTNLPNRLLFSDRVNHAMANARRNKGRIAVLFLDLDDFKAVNDAFSHSQGDQLLITISSRISNCLRETDTVSRFGGDEFAILLENIDKPENIAQVAKKIIHEISQPMVIQANQYSISGSIGISIYPDDSLQADELIQNADAAMYRAKDRGKNTFQFYTPDMTREVLERLRIVTQLKNAVSHNRLELCYQPQVDAQHRKIIGIEALLRFFAPGKGFISPDVFIPIAEKAGMIVEIGEWVLAKACQQSQELTQQGFGLQLSINISGKQLNHPSLVPMVAKALKDTGIRAGMLELEITENSMFENIDYAIHVIKELKDLGVKIAIDDFGTGYSSLGYLTQLALDTIKIDKSFAHNITHDPNRMAVVRGMIAIAQALNVIIVIEGVETREQLKFFRDLDCVIIQGNYYSPPVPISEIPAMLKNGFK
jgi:diguanylate cyclase (GGDEF)-like protein/PAS domain S-box-containing protein